MATLKEAVESGRRWRLKDWAYSDGKGGWNGPGGDIDRRLFVEDAIRSDFEIEPEPEKPREWRQLLTKAGWLHDHTFGGHSCSYEEAHEYVRVHDADACDRLRGK